MSLPAKLVLLAGFSIIINTLAIGTGSGNLGSYLSNFAPSEQSTNTHVSFEKLVEEKLGSPSANTELLKGDEVRPQNILVAENQEPISQLNVFNQQPSAKNTPTLPRLSSASGIDGTGGPRDNAGIDGTGGPRDNTGIDGTGGPETDNSNAGIDGTGGPEEVPQDKGIDGTGGPSSPQDQGIDGTGGPQPEPLSIAPLTEAIGVLDRQSNYIAVNGIRFRITDETSTTINGSQQADTSALNNGHVVTINGRVDETSDGESVGVAEQIIHTTRVSGAISSISATTMTVLGQNITLEHEVVFGGTASAFADLREGDLVNVSGFIRPNGDLSATRIERTNTQDDRVVGSITELDELAKTFVINGLLIDYNAIEEPLTLSNGTTISVQGLINSGDKLTLSATTIDSITPFSDREIKRVEVEGFITEFTEASDFAIGDVRVFTDRQTVFVGNDDDDLAANVKVEVEGQLNENGVLVAEKVLFLVANLTSHRDRTALEESTTTFQWNDVEADAYRLIVLTDHHEDYRYDQTFDGSVTSVELTGLAETHSVMTVSLYTKQGEFWYRKTYLLFGTGNVAHTNLTSHTSDEVLTDTQATFTWSHVEGADAYRLQVYNSGGDAIYFDQEFSQPQPVTVTGLPTNGADLTVALFVGHNGWWGRRAYSLKSVKLIRNATLTSHKNGQKLNGSTDTFIWEDVGADEYEIRIVQETTTNLQTVKLMTIDGSVTSITLDDLPRNSANIRFRLRTRHTVWASEQYRFEGSGEVAHAELTSHKNRETLGSSEQKFTWTEVPEADEYNVTIYNLSVDGKHVFNDDYDNDITSLNTDNLPKNNAKIGFRLSTRVGKYWTHKVYALQGAGELEDTYITSHSPSQPITNSTTTITWKNVGASAYNLSVVDVSSSRHKKLHEQRYDGNTTSAVIENIPNNANIRISVHSKHGDWWGGNNLTVPTNIP